MVISYYTITVLMISYYGCFFSHFWYNMFTDCENHVKYLDLIILKIATYLLIWNACEILKPKISPSKKKKNTTNPSNF